MRARSLLFVPASRPERIPKAFGCGADAVVVDLEDAVPANVKESARRNLGDAFSAGRPPDVSVGVRINRAGSTDWMLDLLCLQSLDVRPAFVMIPKVEHEQEVLVTSRAFSSGWNPEIVALVETSRGLERAVEIARVQGVIALGFGSADYASEVGCSLGFEALLFARSRIAQAAGGAGIDAIDGACLDLDNEVALREEAGRVTALGFTAKVALHPRQVPPINEIFTPSPDTIARARRIVAASEEASGGPASVDGAFVDAPVVAAARRTLSRAR